MKSDTVSYIRNHISLALEAGGLDRKANLDYIDFVSKKKKILNKITTQDEKHGFMAKLYQIPKNGHQVFINCFKT